jgi:hypothetical protein
MANGHGGHRTPRNPAPVSGPGALSRRTDGGSPQGRMQLPDAKYGEQAAFQEAQGGAPMAGSSMPPPQPLTGPSMRPQEPVTAGAASGPGPGPGLGQLSPQRTISDVFQQLSDSDPSGQVADLLAMTRRYNL